MRKKTKILIALVVFVGLVLSVVSFKKPRENDIKDTRSDLSTLSADQEKTASALNEQTTHPMSIEALRQREYAGGVFVIEETLPNGTNYRQFIASYKSEGLKMYGLLTVPLAPKPENGYPAVVFVHGHIPPKQYSTTGSYPGYQAALARGGFVTFKPDLRGHGRSEGEARGAHFSPDYTIDTLHAIAYLENYKDVDPSRLGYWGHSNGGEIGLRVSVINSDIRAYSLWSGVVGTFQDELETYNDKIPFLQKLDDNELIRDYGLPSRNPDFWKKIDPYSYLENVSAPIQLQHATGDKTVPVELSRHLRDELEKIRKKVSYIEYIGDDHNIGANSTLAWQRTIDFFWENL